MDSDSSDPLKAATRLGLPLELVQESENFSHATEGVYPDNWMTVRVFTDLLTQWRMGYSGPVGLDYGAIPVVFRIRKVKPDDREHVFDGIRVMERAALGALRTKES